MGSHGGFPEVSSHFLLYSADMLKVFAYFAGFNLKLIIMAKKRESTSAYWQTFLTLPTMRHIKR